MSSTEGTKAFSTEHAAKSYLKAALSIGYKASIESIVKKGFLPFLDSLKNKSEPITVLATGEGQGKSAGAVDLLLKSLGISNVKFIGTEKEMEQIKEGNAVYNFVLFKIPKHREFIPPKIQSIAEDLPIASGSVDVHMSSQVDHWIKLKEFLLKSYEEAKRVLKKDGLFVHAVSGLVDLGDNNKYHFTRSPFYQEGFLVELKKILISRGYWNDNLGEFDPYNPNVNPFYHQYSLESQQENGIPKMLEEAGFKDIKIDYYMACLDANEMETRMTNLSMLKMHIFQGDFVNKMPQNKKRREKEIVKIAKQAFREAKKSHPDLWNQLASQKNEIIEGMPTDLRYGEPVPVITARKK